MNRPLEVVNLILESVDGNYQDFKRVCLVNSYCRDWARAEALKRWPRLREDVKALGRRVCDVCYHILPVKTWVELAPKFSWLETACVDCRVQKLCSNFRKEFQDVVSSQVDHARTRRCMCCLNNFGDIMRPEVQEQFTKSAMFCNYCEGRISGAIQATKETAKICEKRYEQAIGEVLKTIAAGIANGDLEADAERARKTSGGHVDCDGDIEMVDVKYAKESKRTRSGLAY